MDDTMTAAVTLRELTPVRVTGICTSGRSGRRTPREAASLDGLWTYHRLEIDGRVVWATEHVPSGAEADWTRTLEEARAATASGAALAAVEAKTGRQLA
jgi:hypothetical protein